MRLKFSQVLFIFAFSFCFILFLMQPILAVMHAVSSFVVLLGKPFFSPKV